MSSNFVVEHGITLRDGAEVLDGTVDPSQVGLTAPLGSLYLQSNGKIWQKTDAGDNDWADRGVSEPPSHIIKRDGSLVMKRDAGFVLNT